MNHHMKEITNLMKAIGSADEYCVRKLFPFRYTVPVYTQARKARGFKAVHIINATHIVLFKNNNNK